MMELNERAILALEHWALEYERQEGKGDNSFFGLLKFELKQEALEHKMQLEIEALIEALEEHIAKIEMIALTFFVDIDNQHLTTRTQNALRDWASKQNGGERVARYDRTYTNKDIIRSMYYPNRLTERDALDLGYFGVKGLDWLKQRLVKYGFDPLPKQ